MNLVVPKCCICGKKKAVAIPCTMPDGRKELDLIMMGACDKPRCILTRQRQIG